MSKFSLDIVWETFMQAAKNGQFFSVTFARRTDKYEKIDGEKVLVARKGEPRTMLCRTGVKKHLAGGEAAYSFKDKSLLPVWDVQVFQANKEKGMTDEEAGKRSYRSIPIDSILEDENGKPKISLLEKKG